MKSLDPLSRPDRKRAINSYFAILLFVILSMSRSECLGQTTSSVVTIYCRTSSGSSQGTGFIFGDQGAIVTAYHVIEGARQIEIYGPDFQSLADVFVEYVDPTHDVAVLKSESAADLPGLRPMATRPQPLAPVNVAGSPRGLPNQVLFGSLSSNSPDGTVESTKISAADGNPIFAHNIRVYPIDITIYGGMSGAPVVTNGSSVIGVFSGSYSEGRGIGWCIPIGYVTQLMEQKPLHRTASSIEAWPALTLMGPRWISLKRSYDTPFTAEHIAKLEILEQARRVLRGTWLASGSDKKRPYADTSGCEYHMKEEIVLTFVDVDDKSALLNGTITWKKREYTVFSKPPTSNDKNSCNKLFLKDEDASSITTNLSGSINLSVDDVAGYENALTTNPYITDCQGNGCDADQFGKLDYDDLEVISSTKVRIGKYIFTKIPSV
jgi:hypothetical protein